MFFPFEKSDVVLRVIESMWNIEGNKAMMALAMTMSDRPMAVNMGFQREYAERFDWLKQQFTDWILIFSTSFLYYEDYDMNDEKMPQRLCKHCMKVFVASRPSNEFCSYECKNRHNVYKSRAKKNDNNGEGSDHD